MPSKGAQNAKRHSGVARSSFIFRAQPDDFPIPARAEYRRSGCEFAKPHGHRNRATGLSECSAAEWRGRASETTASVAQEKNGGAPRGVEEAPPTPETAPPEKKGRGRGK